MFTDSFMKRIGILFFSFILLFTFGTTTYAKSVTDLQKKKKNIQSDSNEIKKKADEAKKQISEFQSQVDSFDMELEKVTAEFQNTTTQLELTEQTLDKTQKDLAKAEEDRENQFSALKERMKFMYMNGNISYLEVVFKSKNLSDFLNRVEFINRVIKYDKTLLARLRESEKTIEVKLDETISQKKEIEVLRSQQATRLGALEETIGEKEQLIKKLQSDEKKYMQQVKDLDDTDKEIERLIKAAQAAAVKKSGSSGTASAPYTGGKVGWPVPGRSAVSSYYGSRKSPISGRSEFHTGIDIPAPTGSNIVAADSGTVIYSGTMNGYGLAVLIDHGNTLSTFYGHNSKLLVSVGDSVQKGQTIAKAGSTGYSTGPHCHFEVRVNGSHSDPIRYLKGQ